MSAKFISADAFQVDAKVQLTKGMSQVKPLNNCERSEVTTLAVSADVLSWIHIIIMYLRSEDYIKAERALKHASDAGFTQATFALMLLYYYGLVEGGLTAVLRYSSKAAFAYHAPSMYILGSLLQQGIALQHHPQEAESWLKIARILDPMVACSHKLLNPSEVDDETLIEDIIDTLEAPQVLFDPKKAAASAKRLNTPMPKSGKFVKFNGKPEAWEAFQDYAPESGFQMVRHAAEDGFVTAMYHVSSMYRHGYGTEPNSELADVWFYAARRLDVENKGLHMADFTIN